MRNWLIFAALNGFVGVMAGAFGAHALTGVLDQRALGLVATAERYQMWHALALGIVIALWMHGQGSHGGAEAPMPFFLGLSAWLFAAGIVLFSYSLYALALSGWRPFAMVTPVGGLALLGGWAALAAWALTRRGLP
jgi:uncharacterized membrane protein YgdD (TMEM256/DUF423 family)